MPESLLVAGPIVATILVRLTFTSLQCPVASAMTIARWLEKSLQDAERRNLPALKPLLEALARSMSDLRAAEWNDGIAANVRATYSHDTQSLDVR